MKLAYWMYAGPAHIGTLRIATSFRDIHAIMHAPLGDDYFNVMRSMLERKRDFTPVTASVVDRHVLARGSQEKVIHNIHRKDKEENPSLILLTPTCTSSILQEDLQNFVNRASQDCNADVILADVNHYRVNEMQAADKTLEQIIRFYIQKAKKDNSLKLDKTPLPSVNLIGPCNLSFHHQHDLAELRRLLQDLNISINEIIPEGASVNNIQNLSKAWVNIVPYREIGRGAADFLFQEFNIPYTTISPIGVVETSRFIRQLEQLIVQQGYPCDFTKYIEIQTRFVSQSAWFSRSIDCQNLAGKTAVVFGDATHAAALTKILVKEMGVEVLLAGTYCKGEEEWFKEEVGNYTKQLLFTDDHHLVGDLIAKLEPSAIFGTQMERHIGKRLNIPCGVISAPVHIQNFPLSYRPFMGYEGSNQIADLIYNSFTLGMEDHLLELFGGHDTKDIIATSLSLGNSIEWDENANEELRKIPGFVRGKVKRNVEKFAKTNRLKKITIEVMYAAKQQESSNL
uniref:Light-independent protochlorophyllide reductase subunit B n=1 Tax=Eustigmatophyceae sp. Ndem 8/9T-3m6.8 TaxID=2506146 RepID=A0A3R5UA80_9STRA|nr:protochlorophyllide reductase subunit B [Eustigmatophyceae sp. Ndem 8/9T-3m6.8]QAA11903.1 protochlorophyllide reductase subunit B [Eustigmatophyceae sp. Ndem 8/9T-3m6.8]